MDLFEPGSRTGEPLAARMRPRTLSEYVGQTLILGEGRLLRRLIQLDRVSSLIFYGPPGTGKTTLASVIAHSTQSRFVVLNAVLSGVKQLREEIEEAARQRKLYRRRTLLFVDEVHRWNKSQQDALLPWVENGTVVFIGATTENPFFEVNSALLSRSRLFRLEKLTEEELREIARQALTDPERGYGRFRVEIEAAAMRHLVQTADGDARHLLNALELAVETTPESFPPPDGASIVVSLATAEESIRQKAVLYDKEGDWHYDTISAFIKSIRGSDPDAALYWLARMVHAGEDPRFLFRRMLIAACEEVGLADPGVLSGVAAAAQAFDRVGMPEGRLMLSQAALLLATAPKANSTLGFFDALSRVDREPTPEVPNPLKDAARDGESLGHGKGYLYPHAFTDHWVAQAYLPPELQGKIFYHPGSQGWEGKNRKEVLRRREAQLELTLQAEEAGGSSDPVSRSPENNAFSQWLLRSESGNEAALHLREAFMEAAALQRTHRVLIAEAGSALFYWEALRRAPEGGVFLLTDHPTVEAHIRYFFKEHQIDDTPLLIPGRPGDLSSLENWFSEHPTLQLDCVMGRNLLSFPGDPLPLLSLLKSHLAPNGTILFSQPDGAASSRLSSVLSDADFPDTSLVRRLREAEAGRRHGGSAADWNEERVRPLAEALRLSLKVQSVVFEKRFSDPADSFPETGRSGKAVREVKRWVEAGKGLISESEAEAIVRFFLRHPSVWRRVDTLFRLS